jgi:hypothetical protein
VRIFTGTIAVVAIAVVAMGWLQDPKAITADEALSAARGAYVAAGLRDAVVDPHAERGTYTSTTDDERVPVWKTTAAYDGGTIKLWLARADGESVFLDDRAPDGKSQLLTEAQFRRLADHYDNPAMDRQVRRNLVLTLAASLIALVAVRLALVPRRPRRSLRVRQETS